MDLANFDLGGFIPAETRIDVYQKAIQHIKKHMEIADENKSNAICLLLPVILFDLYSYEDQQPNGNYWDYCNTIVSFSDITLDEIHSISGMENNPMEKNLKRIEVLEKAILRAQEEIKTF